MTKFRYRAFISYSHEDEHWAVWLQRALESYRVPRKLSEKNSVKHLPRRFTPVFRDREDLSSARSLTASLIDALRASEALIVICSPNAAESNWVNEEVREFQALGRGHRVFCMIVDGDPHAPPDRGGCFPPALFDGARDAQSEPLAADPRPFADGKRLARQKLIAGILGVRLDELRQRDLVRRRRWFALAFVVVVAAIGLALLVVTSRIAQEKEREKAEQMAIFIVDLGEDLQSELDLESLARISSRAMSYLQDLDPRKLRPETAIRVGLALRQVGLVNQRQGKSTAALDALERSLQLFRNLARKYPERDDAQFELSQAEFYVGNFFYVKGDYASALGPWTRYREIARTQYEVDPQNRRWLLELSYTSINLVLLRILSVEPVDQKLLDDVAEMVRLAVDALDAWPGDSEVLSHYSNTLAWAADAQLMACRLEEARRIRQQTVGLAEQAARAEPSNKTLQKRLAYRHSGLSAVLTDLGELAEAEKHRLASVKILKLLVTVDPSNVELETELAINQKLLADLMRETGRVEPALQLMQEIRPVLEIDAPLEQASGAQLEKFAWFLLSFTELQRQIGHVDDSVRLLEQAQNVVIKRLDTADSSELNRHLAAQFRYEWFLLRGQDPALEHPSMARFVYEAKSPFRSCFDAEFNAKLAIFREDSQGAQEQAEYLAEHGYRHPAYLQFCHEQGLCSP